MARPAIHWAARFAPQPGLRLLWWARAFIGLRARCGRGQGTDWAWAPTNQRLRSQGSCSSDGPTPPSDTCKPATLRANRAADAGLAVDVWAGLPVGGVGPRKQLTLVECSRWIVGPHAGNESMLCAPSKESPKQATRAPVRTASGRGRRHRSGPAEASGLTLGLGPPLLARFARPTKSRLGTAPCHQASS